jgi:hypothetical protein
MLTLRELVQSRGGVVRTPTLASEGIGRAALASAVACGELVRVRRGWLATPTADPFLVAAARAGVVVSCVSQARRLGLWVFADDRPHVAAPPHARGG